MSVSKDDVFRTVIAMVLSLLAYIGHGIKSEQIDMACRLRSLEISQARIMERMGIEQVSSLAGTLHSTSQKRPSPD
jgi:hypothetical protein